MRQRARPQWRRSLRVGGGSEVHEKAPPMPGRGWVTVGCRTVPHVPLLADVSVRTRAAMRCDWGGPGTRACRGALPRWPRNTPLSNGGREPRTTHSPFALAGFSFGWRTASFLAALSRPPPNSGPGAPRTYSCRLAGFFFVAFEPCDRPRRQIVWGHSPGD
jgi:hypothetical protein